MEKSNVQELLNFGYIIYPNHHKYHFCFFYISIDLYTRNYSVLQSSAEVSWRWL